VLIAVHRSRAMLDSSAGMEHIFLHNIDLLSICMTIGTALDRWSSVEALCTQLALGELKAGQTRSSVNSSDRRS